MLVSIFCFLVFRVLSAILLIKISLHSNLRVWFNMFVRNLGRGNVLKDRVEITVQPSS